MQSFVLKEKGSFHRKFNILQATRKKLGLSMSKLYQARRRGHSLIWPMRVCVAEQGMVLKVLSLKEGNIYNFTIKRLEQSVFGLEVFQDLQ